MFYTNVLEKQEYKRESKYPDKKHLLRFILGIYKKIKDIAKHEENLKINYKIAKLDTDRLYKLKKMETDFGMSLVAYDSDEEAKQCKHEILNRINSLLNEYTSIINKSQKKSGIDEFKGFFEQ